jgi:hypothetical protein
MKTVVYLGLEFRVPANWPVYRLDLRPSTCVRYDIHAVYLGMPGPAEQCPAHLVGRTQTVSVVPAAALGSQPGMTGGTVVGNLTAVHAALVQDPQQHVFRVAVGAATASAATVVATYGASPAMAEQVLASLRAVPAAARPIAARPEPQQQQQQQQPASQIAVRPPPPWWVLRPVPGFDTCTAPSLATMRAWRHAFRATGIYIGGVNKACAYGNLSPSWIRRAARMGWEMLPLYVGPQAPCWGGGGIVIDPGHAAAEGTASANDAIAHAAFFGLRRGSPVYYDMEGYHHPDRPCTRAVLAFIGAWSRQLIRRGYLPAFYSSRNSGIADMEAGAVARTRGFTAPRAIWIADWDGRRTLTAGGPLVWPFNRRTKQYLSPHRKTVGGITLDIQSDLIGGPVVR